MTKMSAQPLMLTPAPFGAPSAHMASPLVVSRNLTWIVITAGGRADPGGALGCSVKVDRMFTDESDGGKIGLLRWVTDTLLTAGPSVTLDVVTGEFVMSSPLWPAAVAGSPQ